LEELAIDVGLVNLFIGAVWAMAWRADWPLMGYSPQWVVLTALHFHVAGFAPHGADWELRSPGSDPLGSAGRFAREPDLDLRL
jgi:hypothetical protein